MAALVPCSACRRHLRQQETQCPFCGAQQPLAAAQRKQIAIPRDASRATIFALGLTLAGQACGASAKTPTEHDNQGGFTSVVPPYGAITCVDNPLLAGCPTPQHCKPSLDCDGSAASGGSNGSGGGSGLTNSGGSNGTAGNAGRSDAGAVFDAGAEDAGAEDAGGDAATDDAGN